MTTLHQPSSASFLTSRHAIQSSRATDVAQTVGSLERFQSDSVGSARSARPCRMRSVKKVDGPPVGEPLTRTLC